ncbi:hypothetical protein CPB84DRAFT_1165065 [Gymnopilus junonius]|uniref:Uncharacterized protein n=1 Tax=Gymnopilus junonius TaxID=109634 RepID=A0A9P5NJE5_GYMJU|nr:hypothetical protein CPB84DRAFT_1165065 [Gymnopilus junonius]
MKILGMIFFAPSYWVQGSPQLIRFFYTATRHPWSLVMKSVCYWVAYIWSKAEPSFILLARFAVFFGLNYRPGPARFLTEFGSEIKRFRTPFLSPYDLFLGPRRPLLPCDLVPVSLFGFLPPSVLIFFRFLLVI